MNEWPRTAHHRRGEWKKLAVLIMVVLAGVGASLGWAAWRRQHPGPPLPVLIPGTVIQPPRR